MDFLTQLAIPQSLEHYHLVVLLATISSLVFVPYISFVVGSSVLSLWFNRKARHERSTAALEFSRALIETAFYNRNVVTFLAIIPALSLVFSYAQILLSTPAIAVGLMGFGFIFLLVGLVLLYSYKYTFRVQGILSSYQELLKRQKNAGAAIGEVETYSAQNTHAHLRSGRYGLSFLLVGVFLYVAAYSVASSNANWSSVDSFVALFLTGDVWMKLLFFAGLVVGSTGIGMIFFFTVWRSDQYRNDAELLGLVKRVGLRWSIVALLALPVLLIVNVALMAPSSVSGNVYGLAGVGLFGFFIAAHFIYGYHKTNNQQSVAYALFSFLFGVAILTVNDYVAVGNTTKDHAAYLAFVHDKALEELRSKLGVTLVVMTGEDIYNAKCSACHLFDQKKVGPPYFETIPKYATRKADLISFILNPRKMNPAYPPMPNQGLKPAEADSIAGYIMRKVATAGKMKIEAAQPPAK